MREFANLTFSRLIGGFKKSRTDAGPDALNAAVARGATFLKQRLRSGEYDVARRNEDGARRFHHGTGHVVVAYFLSEAMLELLDEIDRNVMLVRILSEENGGAWAYSRAYDLVDSDDTA